MNDIFIILKVIYLMIDQAEMAVHLDLHTCANIAIITQLIIILIAVLSLVRFGICKIYKLINKSTHKTTDNND